MPGSIATPGSTCPLRRKDVSKVCHTCAWHVQVHGMNPQTGERVDRWQCAITAQVMATLSVGQAANGAADATQQLRNDIERRQDASARLLARKVPEVGKYIGQPDTLRLSDDSQQPS